MGLKAPSSETPTVLIIFFITSDDKPNLRRSRHESSQLHHVCWMHQLPSVELNKMLKYPPFMDKGR